MKRKWLESEVVRWVKEGIIAKDQAESILALYKKETMKSMLPVYASLLIGIGILTLVASNWAMFSEEVRLAIICVTLAIFYLSGDICYRKGRTVLGMGLLILGVISFGGGIFLVGQMYQLQAFNANAFAMWAFVSLLLMLFFKEKGLFYVAFVILTIGQIYSFSRFSTVNWPLYLLLLFGLGHFTYHRVSYQTSALFSLSFIIMSEIIVSSYQLSLSWAILPPLITFVSALWIKKKDSKAAFLYSSLIAIMIFTTVEISILDYTSEVIKYPALFLILWGTLFGLALMAIWKWKQMFNLAILLLYLPLGWLGQAGSFIALAFLFILAVTTLLHGYKYERKDFVNLGTALFLYSTFIGYFQWAWNNMSKSTFFFSGGLLLFLLSWVLDRKRRKVFQRKEGDKQ